MFKQNSKLVKSDSRERSRDSDQNQKQWTQQKYDRFLFIQKKNTFKRLEKFKTLSTPIRHQCNNCKRIWKPAPKKCLPNDYYCPSCALHHRNNISRFQQPRFSWTANIPNTFYLYKIVDSETKYQFYKYGRTQHQKSDNRYSSIQKKKYSMALQYSTRGALKNMTAIQNLWKKLANDYKIKPDFSNKQFHGATQCIVLSQKLLKQLIAISEQISKMDYKSYLDFKFQDLDTQKQKIILQLIQKVKTEQFDKLS